MQTPLFWGWGGMYVCLCMSYWYVCSGRLFFVCGVCVHMFICECMRACVCVCVCMCVCVMSSHLYLYSAFNKTNCNKATAQYQNRKIQYKQIQIKIR